MSSREKRKALSRKEELPEFDSVQRFNDKRVFLIYKKINSNVATIIHDGEMFEAFNYHKEISAANEKSKVKRKIVIAKVETSILEDFILRYERATKELNNGEKKGLISSVTSSLKSIESKEESDSFLNEEDSVYDKDFTNVITEAVSKKVSDVHIEVRENGTRVRFRQYGKLHDVRYWSFEYGNKLCNVLFTVMAQELQGVMFNPAAPQFARVSKKISGVEIGMRVNSIPAFPNGYDVVTRILKMSNDSGNEDTLKIADLGYNKEQLSQIRYAMAQRSGAIIIAGTTGSGKSTTLQCLLKEKVRSEPYLKIITIEDPPEYFIPGVTQVPVKRKSKDGEEFVEAIKACMRCDPDIIMIGETRDVDTALLMQAAVLTGHKTLSTIHAKDAIAVVARLEKMTVERMTMATKGFISLFMFQSLVPLSCPYCKIPFSSDKGRAILDKKYDDISDMTMDYWIKSFEEVSKHSGIAYNPDNIFFVNEDGCKKCSNGVVGASVVAEVLNPSLEVLKCISEGDDFGAQRAWVNGGGRPINLHAIDKVMEGVVCPINAEHVVGPLQDCLHSLPDKRLN